MLTGQTTKTHSLSPLLIEAKPDTNTQKPYDLNNSTYTHLPEDLQTNYATFGGLTRKGPNTGHQRLKDRLWAA